MAGLVLPGAARLGPAGLAKGLRDAALPAVVVVVAVIVAAAAAATCNLSPLQLEHRPCHGLHQSRQLEATPALPAEAEAGAGACSHEVGAF